MRRFRNRLALVALLQLFSLVMVVIAILGKTEWLWSIAELLHEFVEGD